ncbi:MAG: hypothetical protein Q4B28_00535 [bacterium]|nr:hypothetical protein [bacterium]
MLNFYLIGAREDGEGSSGRWNSIVIRGLCFLVIFGIAERTEVGLSRTITASTSAYIDILDFRFTVNFEKV